MSSSSGQPVEIVRQHERVAVFIDGPNLFSTAKVTGFEIDYKKMLAYFEDECVLARAYYYTAVADDPEEFSPVKPLIDWLGYNGFTMVTKPMKEFTDETGRKRQKGNMDIEIAVDMMNTAQWEGEKAVSHIVLFSGDGDFRRLIESVQDRGIRVTVISSVGSDGKSMIADDLRRQADRFIDLKHLREDFGRPPRVPA